jgi:hypothetical protein
MKPESLEALESNLKKKKTIQFEFLNSIIGFVIVDLTHPSPCAPKIRLLILMKRINTLKKLREK